MKQIIGLFMKNLYYPRKPWLLLLAVFLRIRNKLTCMSNANLLMICR